MTPFRFRARAGVRWLSSLAASQTRRPGDRETGRKTDLLVSLSPCLLVWLACLAQAAPEVPKLSPDREPHTRSFRLMYSGAITGLKSGETVRVWLPVPSSSDDQDIRDLNSEIPGEGKLHSEPRYGNRMLFFQATADADGKVPFGFTCRVLRREVLGARSKELEQDMRRLTRFLEADARVPLDGKPQELIQGKQLPSDVLGKARAIYDIVNNHMRYSKEGIGWGNGDAVWACQSGYGNCSDFHSLFMALARAQKIPAKFEIGFPLPAKHGAGDIAGYHCWAKFYLPRKGWIPVDISEANKDPKLRDYYFGNLTQDRVAFSTGRDLDLAPKQAGPPLNFFIHPYAESAGKPVPMSQVQLKVAYQDNEANEER
jgi:transglutaminase-like putative cysteine protease